MQYQMDWHEFFSNRVTLARNFRLLREIIAYKIRSSHFLEPPMKLSQGLALNSHPSGRHFLQIPGPTNVPDRILRAMDYPTIDHRGPEFQRLGKAPCSAASARSSRPISQW
jgi:hypothetical protein